MTPPNASNYRAIVDTRRNPVGAKLRDKMAEACLFDPKKPLPQANAQDLVAARDFLDLDAMMANAHALEESCRPIVEEVLPDQADRDLVFWKTSNRIFRLGL